MWEKETYFNNRPPPPQMADQARFKRSFGEAMTVAIAAWGN